MGQQRDPQWSRRLQDGLGGRRDGDHVEQPCTSHERPHRRQGQRSRERIRGVRRDAARDRQRGEWLRAGRHLQRRPDRLLPGIQQRLAEAAADRDRRRRGRRYRAAHRADRTHRRGRVAHGGGPELDRGDRQHRRHRVRDLPRRCPAHHGGQRDALRRHDRAGEHDLRLHGAGSGRGRQPVRPEQRSRGDHARAHSRPRRHGRRRPGLRPHRHRLQRRPRHVHVLQAEVHLGPAREPGSRGRPGARGHPVRVWRLQRLPPGPTIRRGAA